MVYHVTSPTASSHSRARITCIRYCCNHREMDQFANLNIDMINDRLYHAMPSNSNKI